MTLTTDPETAAVQGSGPPWGSRLRTTLLAVIGVGLLLLGGGAAVALGVGRGAEPGADSVDAGFARDMSHHHLQAVEMANLAPDRSTDPAVRRLAFDIAETQQNQAGRMQGWLSLWGLPFTSSNERMAWMSGGHAGHSMLSDGRMPGMASEAELTHLRSLSGTAFDVEFLRLMIRHHQGGSDMAEDAAANAAEPAVRTLAKAMAETQAAEITTMADMLAERGGQPLPAP